MKVAVFGLGYVGTVTAACLTARGHDVWGVDVDGHKVATVADGRSPVLEPGLGELVADGVAAGRLHATTDAASAVESAQVSLVCVGTPSSPNGSTDLSFIEQATGVIAEALRSTGQAETHHVVAIRSTVPPGTVDDLVRPILEREGVTAGVAMCPEFLREGSGVADFNDPPFTVVGTADETAASVLAGLLAPAGEPSHVVEARTAESLKYACNAFHATKVAFANEIARVFRPYGIDARQVMHLFCQDDRLNIATTYLRPGFAFGGPCLPKDLRSVLHMARSNSVDLPLLSGVMSSNELLLAEVAGRVTDGPGMTVALIGLSFKTSSDDLRESPSVRLAETLLGKGYDVRIHDPIVNPQKLIGTNRRYVESKLPHLGRLLSDTATEALRGADVAVVVSADAAVVADLLESPPPRIIDLSGTLGADVEALPGYEGVGW